MARKLLIPCALFFTFLAANAVAQTRYALIIGINKYYPVKGIADSALSLHGCVEDGMAVKGLLQTRFGFKDNEFKELYDSNATWNNIITALYKLIDTVKKGDVVFIYYSGHGINLLNLKSVKNGHSQGIVTCDLYSTFPSIIRDNDFKRIFNAFTDKKAIVTFLTDCCYAGGLVASTVFEFKEHYKEDAKKAPPFGRGDNFIDESFKENDEILAKKIPITTENINDALQVERPADKDESMFLQIGATDENTESFVIKDEFNRRHGLFTKALLDVYKTYPASTPSLEIVNKITDLLQDQKLAYRQKTITNSADARLTGNLIGSNPAYFNDTLVFTCTSVKNGIITINGGFLQGLAPGNGLVGINGKNKITAIIKNTNENDASITPARPKQTIKPGNKFKLVDYYEKTKPIIRLYIPNDCDTVAFNNTIKQYSNNFNRYMLLGYPTLTKYNPAMNPGIVINADGKKFTYSNPDFKTFTSIKLDTSYLKGPSQTSADSVYLPHLVFLPFTSNIATALKKEITGDQQVMLVNKADEADYVLLCNYISPEKFVFTISNNFNAKNFPGGSFMFEKFNAVTSTVNFTKDEAAAFAKKIHETVVLALVRDISGGFLWFNRYKAR